MWKLILFKEAHGHAEIILTEEEQVHSGNGRDFVDVLDAIRGFYLQGDDYVAVRAAGIAEKAFFIHAALRQIDRARAGSGIPRATHCLARFIRVVDVRNKNAVRPKVQRLLVSGASAVASATDNRFRVYACGYGKR